ncbi:unnamed protein product [Coregonus sp. 'balchen']|nr:unnamed protein product [Coregonus sp. 'balchen']
MIIGEGDSCWALITMRTICSSLEQKWLLILHLDKRSVGFKVGAGLPLVGVPKGLNLTIQMDLPFLVEMPRNPDPMTFFCIIQPHRPTVVC